VQGSYAALTLPELCDQCGLCAEVCPEEAIELAFGIVWGDGQQGKGG
jgi:ferredoxin